MPQTYVEEGMQKHIQDMEIGDKFITKSRVITKTDLELYAISTGDTHPMFLSEEAAQEAGWRTQLVPGLLGLSVAVGLLLQSGYISQVTAFMAADKVKFLAPLYPSDSIRVETEVLSKRQTSKGNFVCSYKWVIKNQRNEPVSEGENT